MKLVLNIIEFEDRFHKTKICGPIQLNLQLHVTVLPLTISFIARQLYSSSWIILEEYIFHESYFRYYILPSCINSISTVYRILVKASFILIFSTLTVRCNLEFCSYKNTCRVFNLFKFMHIYVT